VEKNGGGGGGGLGAKTNFPRWDGGGGPALAFFFWGLKKDFGPVLGGSRGKKGEPQEKNFGRGGGRNQTRGAPLFYSGFFFLVSRAQGNKENQTLRKSARGGSGVLALGVAVRAAKTNHVGGPGGHKRGGPAAGGRLLGGGVEGRQIRRDIPGPRKKKN